MILNFKRFISRFRENLFILRDGATEIEKSRLEKSSHFIWTKTINKNSGES